MILKNTDGGIELKAESEKDYEYLRFLIMLDDKKALPDLLETFADMINKDVFKVTNGKVIWNSDFEIIKEQLQGYA